MEKKFLTFNSRYDNIYHVFDKLKQNFLLFKSDDKTVVKNEPKPFPAYSDARNQRSDVFRA